MRSTGARVRRRVDRVRGCARRRAPRGVRGVRGGAGAAPRRSPSCSAAADGSALAGTALGDATAWADRRGDPRADDQGAPGGAAARAQRAAGEAVRALGASARHSTRGSGRASSSRALDGAVAQRGAFRLGPIDLDLVPGERLAVTGRNGSGKSTLLGMLLGEVPCSRERARSAARRRSARSRQDAGRVPARAGAPRRVRRTAPGSPPSMRARCSRSSGSARSTSGVPARRCRPVSARGRTSPSSRHATSTCSCSTSRRTTSTSRPSSSSSRRSRGYDGTLVVVSHDRPSSSRSSRRGSCRCPAVTRDARASRRYTPRPPMAVPKQKTSRPAETSAAPSTASRCRRVNVCPNCGQPKRPHHVCPTCKTYRGRDSRAAPHSRAVALHVRSGSPWTPSGATGRRRRSSPARSTLRRRIRAGALRPGRPRHARARAASRARMRRDGRQAGRGGPRETRLLARARVRAVGDGEADAVVSAGNTGAMLAA